MKTKSTYAKLLFILSFIPASIIASLQQKALASGAAIPVFSLLSLPGNSITILKCRYFFYTARGTP
jgi:hypothetical protein